MMVLLNKKMRKILKKSSVNEFQNDIDKKISEIINATELIENCIIYNPAHEVITKDTLDNMLSYANDYTGVEIGFNEIYYPNFQDVQPIQEFSYNLWLALSNRYNRSIIVYFILDKDAGNVRFHSIHHGEKKWLVENLESYDEPVLEVNCYNQGKCR